MHLLCKRNATSYQPHTQTHWDEDMVRPRKTNTNTHIYYSLTYTHHHYCRGWKVEMCFLLYVIGRIALGHWLKMGKFAWMWVEFRKLNTRCIHEDRTFDSAVMCYALGYVVAREIGGCWRCIATRFWVTKINVLYDCWPVSICLS